MGAALIRQKTKDKKKVGWHPTPLPTGVLGTTILKVTEMAWIMVKIEDNNNKKDICLGHVSFKIMLRYLKTSVKPFDVC